ncbi:MAG: hypothetical protein RR597_07300, partial [Christensenella sp.]
MSIAQNGVLAGRAEADIMQDMRGYAEEQGGETHTPEMQKIIKEYDNSVDEDLVAFAQNVMNAKSDKSNKLSYELSEVTSREVSDIERLTGIDVSGYEHNIRGNTINHIVKRHGADGLHDKSMANIEDIGRIQYVLDNYDSVDILTDQNGEPVTTSTFLNSDGTQSDVLVFSKRINGTYYIIEAVPVSKTSKLQILSSRIVKNKKGASQVLNMQSPQLTSETPLAIAPLDSNISQGKQNVNGNE